MATRRLLSNDKKWNRAKLGRPIGQNGLPLPQEPFARAQSKLNQEPIEEEEEEDVRKEEKEREFSSRIEIVTDTETNTDSSENGK